MTFWHFAVNNVLRNFSLYAAYFISCVFSVFVFFVYTVFSFHPALTPPAMDSKVSLGFHVAEAVLICS